MRARERGREQERNQKETKMSEERGREGRSGERTLREKKIRDREETWKTGERRKKIRR